MITEYRISNGSLCSSRNIFSHVNTFILHVESSVWLKYCALHPTSPPFPTQDPCSSAIRAANISAAVLVGCTQAIIWQFLLENLVAVEDALVEAVCEANPLSYKYCGIWVDFPHPDKPKIINVEYVSTCSMIASL